MGSCPAAFSGDWAGRGHSGCAFEVWRSRQLLLAHPATAAGALFSTGATPTRPLCPRRASLQSLARGGDPSGQAKARAPRRKTLEPEPRCLPLPDSLVGDSLCGTCAPQWRFLERHGSVSVENLRREWVARRSGCPHGCGECGLHCFCPVCSLFLQKNHAHTWCWGPVGVC